MTARTTELLENVTFPADAPDATYSARTLFGIDTAMHVGGFRARTSLVPKLDKNYVFDRETTLAVLSGFSANRRVMIRGYHGTGKSTHIEQIAARLNWPLVRINLDGNISRTDLVGRDSIVVRDGLQVTEFQDGTLPWALRHPCALLFDEYDAARPEVMFVIQRILEADGQFTLLDQNSIIRPHEFFRMFATSNTVGLDDGVGLYHGTQRINQGQMDRWNVVAGLDYLPIDVEMRIVQSKVPAFDNAAGIETVRRMVEMAALTRSSFAAGDITNMMSPRTVIAWAENACIFDDIGLAFRYAFLNRCEETEVAVVVEFYQRCFDEDPVPKATSV